MRFEYPGRGVGGGLIVGHTGGQSLFGGLTRFLPALLTLAAEAVVGCVDTLLGSYEAPAEKGTGAEYEVQAASTATVTRTRRSPRLIE